MSQRDPAAQPHDHNFLGHAQEKNERRTWLVIGLTAVTMVVEIVCGILFGSMALLADGWHMASHAAALSLTAVAYLMSRRYARDERFCFGTGKIGELAGFASALLLALIALLMAYESIKRMAHPVSIDFDQAIAVAVIGLAVNLVSAWLLWDRDHHHDHGHGHADHNLKSAYLHVIADALTSVLAIAALTAGRFGGWVWLDPVMGIVGAVVITRWSWGLLKTTGRTLLDMSSDQELSDAIRAILQNVPDVRIDDLHLWRVGPGHFSAIVSITAADPQAPDHYKRLLGDLRGLSHLTVEVNS